MRIFCFVKKVNILRHSSVNVLKKPKIMDFLCSLLFKHAANVFVRPHVTFKRILKWLVSMVLIEMADGKEDIVYRKVVRVTKLHI